MNSNLSSFLKQTECLFSVEMEMQMETELSNGTLDESGSIEDNDADDFFAFLYPYFLNRDPTAFGAWYQCPLNFLHCAVL